MCTMPKYISLLCIFIMLAALGYGFSTGDFFNEGSELINMPWGMVTLIDLYVGIVIFSAWVWFRETSSVKCICWTLAFIFTGNLATALYLFKAVNESKGDQQIFFFGKGIKAS